MAPIFRSLSLILFLAFLLLAVPTFSADSPEISPSPSLHLPPGVISLPPESPSPSPALPYSPPSPPPSDIAHNSPSPAPSPGEDDGASSDKEKFAPPAPAPAPDVAADVSHDDQMNTGDMERKDGTGGMNGGQKAGIAIGVVASAFVVGLGAMVYKKRQHNIRRSQYGIATRSEFL